MPPPRELRQKFPVDPMAGELLLATSALSSCEIEYVDVGKINPPERATEASGPNRWGPYVMDPNLVHGYFGRIGLSPSLSHSEGQVEAGPWSEDHWESKDTCRAPLSTLVSS